MFKLLEGNNLIPENQNGEKSFTGLGIVFSIWGFELGMPPNFISVYRVGKSMTVSIENITASLGRDFKNQCLVSRQA